jgi:hypothetical protein
VLDILLGNLSYITSAILISFALHINTKANWLTSLSCMPYLTRIRFPSVSGNIFCDSFWVFTGRLKSRFSLICPRQFRFSLSYRSKFCWPPSTAQFQSYSLTSMYLLQYHHFCVSFLLLCNKFSKTQHLLSLSCCGQEALYAWVSWIPCSECHISTFEVSTRLHSHPGAQLGNKESAFKLIQVVGRISLLWLHDNRPRHGSDCQLGVAEVTCPMSFSTGNSRMAVYFKARKRMSPSSLLIWSLT